MPTRIRTLLASAALAAALLPPALAGGLFGFIKRGDPKIQTLTYVDRAAARLPGRRIAVLPFEVSPDLKPPPPGFGRFLHRALLSETRPA